MTLAEIKTAIEDGKTVHWSNSSYKVIKDNIGQYLITHDGGYCIGLTWTDNVTLNGKEKDFYIAEPKKVFGNWRKVYFSLDAENSVLIPGYYHQASHMGGWPEAYLERFGVDILIAENQKDRDENPFDDFDKMEMEGDVLKITLSDSTTDEKDEVTEDCIYRIHPEKVDVGDGVIKTLYGIGRYCWHIDEVYKVEEDLAEAFSKVLASWLTTKQQKEVIRRNKKYKDIHCASHDFCDANMAMDEAFQKFVCRHWRIAKYNKEKDELIETEDLNLINAAWDIAKRNDFYFNKT